MRIVVNLDVMMAKRKMSLGELAQKVDITMANLSILKTGKARAVRLETLDRLCAALDCGRRLGLQVTKSLLMTPVKSVTAIVGLADRPQMARIRGCGYCAMRERCQLRKGGKSCGL